MNLTSVRVGVSVALASLLVWLFIRHEDQLEPPTTSLPVVDSIQESSNSVSVKLPDRDRGAGDTDLPIAAASPGPKGEIEIQDRESASSREDVMLERSVKFDDKSALSAQFEMLASVLPKALHHSQPQLKSRMVTVPSPDYIIENNQSEASTSSDIDMVGMVSAADVLGGGNLTNVDKTNPQKFTDDESDFAETRWIVQESQTLDEKKSIWLSYIAREKNKTYREMGIYNLALVLAKIAEETRNPDDATYAISFFEENETSLRQQLSDKRFEVKIQMLQMIRNF